MAEFTAHVPGTVSWAELATTDQAGAVAFYGALLGWDTQDIPLGPGQTYSMFMLRGKEVAAAQTMQAQQRQAGVPPHWSLYITVANVDAAVTRATALGGSVLLPAFEVMNAGRMAVLRDPTGAAFSVWEPKAHIGAKILSEPGALCWSELTTRDPKAAVAFYSALLGWQAESTAGGSGVPYTQMRLNGQASVGIFPMPEHVPPQVPSFWMPYLQVANCAASTQTAKSLEARVLLEMQDVPKTGRFTMLQDPQGAMFALFEFTGA